MLIDFTRMSDSKILSGRENGKKARDYFKVIESSEYVIKTTEDQLVTSSYFLGLLGGILSKQFKSPNDALKSLNFEHANEKSRREFVKAIRRGLSNNRGLV